MVAKEFGTTRRSSVQIGVVTVVLFVGVVLSGSGQFGIVVSDPE